MLGTDGLLVREICVSCHLGPLERETGPYVEHRLRRSAGRAGRPSTSAPWMKSPLDRRDSAADQPVVQPGIVAARRATMP